MGENRKKYTTIKFSHQSCTASTVFRNILNKRMKPSSIFGKHNKKAKPKYHNESLVTSNLVEVKLLTTEVKANVFKSITVSIIP